MYDITIREYFDDFMVNTTNYDKERIGLLGREIIIKSIIKHLAKENSEISTDGFLKKLMYFEYAWKQLLSKFIPNSKSLIRKAIDGTLKEEEFLKYSKSICDYILNNSDSLLIKKNEKGDTIEPFTLKDLYLNYRIFEVVIKMGLIDGLDEPFEKNENTYLVNHKLRRQYVQWYLVNNLWDRENNNSIVDLVITHIIGRKIIIPTNWSEIILYYKVNNFWKGIYGLLLNNHIITNFQQNLIDSIRLSLEYIGGDNL